MRPDICPASFFGFHKWVAYRWDKFGTGSRVADGQFCTKCGKRKP